MRSLPPLQTAAFCVVAALGLAPIGASLAAPPPAVPIAAPPALPIAAPPALPIAAPPALPIAAPPALPIAAPPALPIAAPPPGDPERPGRYTMQPTDGGFLRLDTMTGDVSLCARAGQTFECKPVKDDRDLQSEMARLSAENKELKVEIKRLEDMLGLNGGPHQGKRKLELPSEEDVDKALGYLERMFKKFRDKMKEFDLEGGREGKGTPL